MNAESLKARLKNFAAESGHTFQEALIYYGLERTVYRISISPYAEHFVLKGGIFLYAIFQRDYERATTDVDLLAKRISNSGEIMKEVFKEIFSQDTDDALVFDMNSIKVEDITEFKEYHGLHISITGYLDRTKIPIGIDIGYGDIVYPNAVKIDFPVILDMDAPVVNAYSIESSIAEKLQAIVQNGYLNSRYKDFYDIYVLSRKFSFTYPNMREAVAETFQNRGTAMTAKIAAFSDEFRQDAMHQTRWKAFLKKKRVMLQIAWEDVLLGVKTFATPLLEQSASGIENWNPIRGNWQ